MRRATYRAPRSHHGSHSDTHTGALSSPTHNAPAQVLLALNSVSEAGRQRALAVSGLEMESTQGASRSARGGPGAGRSGVR